MRSPRRCVAVLLGALLLSPVPAIADTGDPSGVIASSNVSAVTTLANPGAIGARFKDHWMFTTSTLGLQVYDVSIPRAPVEVARLPLPHFENEDVDLGGDILLISNDAAESTGVLYVIDISDPRAPALRSTTPLGGNPLLGGPGHTASCVLGCQFAWVTDGGGIRVIDLRDPDAPVTVGIYPTVAGGLVTHDVQLDGDGLMWVAGFNGTAAYRVPAGYEGDGLGDLVTQTDLSGQSTYDEEFGLGDGNHPNDFIHHNSLRHAGSPVAYVTEEDYTRPGCRGAGTFQTWKLRLNEAGLPRKRPMVLMDSWRTELLEDAAAPAVMCSAHYFDVRRNVVAQAWYQQGVRFLDVSRPRDVRQIGYYIPPDSLTWSAYFPPTDTKGRVVYVLDYVNGITVLELRLPRGGSGDAPTVRAPILERWTSDESVPLAAHPDFQAACLLPSSAG